MSTKYFIWIVRVSIYLLEFSWNFQNNLSIFHAFKTISRFSGIVFAFKIISENKIFSSPPPGPAADPHLLHPAQPPTRSWLTRAQRLAEVVASTAGAPPVILGGHASQSPYKGRCRAPRAPC
jgi:hypothetical protein